MSMSKRNIIWLLMAFFFIADLAAAVHKGKKEVILSEQSLRDNCLLYTSDAADEL